MYFAVPSLRPLYNLMKAVLNYNTVNCMGNRRQIIYISFTDAQYQ